MSSSVMESSELVASSMIKMGAFFKIALAIAILCLWSPDNLTPFFSNQGFVLFCGSWLNLMSMGLLCCFNNLVMGGFSATILDIFKDRTMK